jgi:hypothetical protein
MKLMANGKSRSRREAALHQRGGSQRAYMLIEVMVYLSILLAILGVGYAALYRCIDCSVALRRSANDITGALRAGERWRADVRGADQKVWLETNGPEPILHLSGRQGEIAYRSASHAVFRSVNQGPWIGVLSNAAASTMEPDPRKSVTAWHWELELHGHAKSGRVRPLFTFMAVPEKSPIK